MRRPLIAIAGLIAAAALGALAAASLADREPMQELAVDPDRVPGVLAVEPSPGPGERVARAGQGRAGQVSYFESKPLEVAPQTEEAATLQCPGGHKATSGFFVTGQAGTFLDLSSPQRAYTSEDASNRGWVLGVFNSSPEPSQVKFGVVCLKKKT
jgi:hypothetical protein